MKSVENDNELYEIEDTEHKNHQKSRNSSKRKWDIVNREVYNEEFNANHTGNITKDVGKV